MIEMLIGFAVVFLGLTLIVKGWSLIYRGEKGDELVKTGIYGLMRHPQYTGIFLALFGQLIHWPTILTVIFFPVIVGLYYRLARKEEKGLLTKFGEEYKSYMREVPMFFPKFKSLYDLAGRTRS